MERVVGEEKADRKSVFVACVCMCAVVVVQLKISKTSNDVLIGACDQERHVRFDAAAIGSDVKASKNKRH